MMGKSRRNKGFTMVELIVVIVIILVLAAVLVPSLLKYIRKAQEAAAIEECAGVVRMAAVERAQWLADGGTAPTKEEIVSSAGASGEIEVVNYDDDEFEVINMQYKCKNGLVVIYERDEDPQYHIMGENESSPTTIIQNWINEANKVAVDNKGAGRDKTIKNMILNGGLLPVNDTFKKGTNFEDNDLVWYPYYIGPEDKRFTLLFAGEPPSGTITETTTSGYWNNWNAKIIYVDGKRYVKGSSGGNIANIWIKEKVGDKIIHNETIEDVESWLSKNGFTPVD